MSDDTEADDGGEGEEFEAVCDVDEVPDLRPKLVEVGDRRVLLCRSGGDVWAVDEICPHENESMRYGVVQRGEIVCPHHQYRFDLETGKCRRRCPPAQLYETRVEEGTVYVKT